ncbi:hypothetical protein [Mesorhizobium amorphae]|uniref:hypothetical protein n=1 Tax=Mesorhizobium amorphae TaxID=71433 RepID=UPI00118683B9|nr:hypothetical protein [Mesorhizobium amorphae]
MAKRTETVPGEGHNSSGISEDSLRVLFFMNRTDYHEALAAKKLADAKMKVVGKQIKADLGEFGLAQIKAYDQAQTPEGQAGLKAEIDAMMQAMSFAGMPVGTQLDLLADRADSIERAARDGEEAGMRGDSLVNPYNGSSPEGQAYAEHWHAGQKAIFAIRQLRRKAEADELIAGHDSDDVADVSDNPFADITTAEAAE